MSSNDKNGVAIRGSVPPNFQPSLELQQQINILNARITAANLSYSDLLKELDITFKSVISTIISLQTENAELKAKQVKA